MLCSQGYNLELYNGEILQVFGAVLCAVGDVPASNFLGGFKEGVGFALRKCRRCMATQSEICTKVQFSFIIRKAILTMSSHSLMKNHLC